MELLNRSSCDVRVLCGCAGASEELELSTGCLRQSHALTWLSLDLTVSAGESACVMCKVCVVRQGNRKRLRKRKGQ